MVTRQGLAVRGFCVFGQLNHLGALLHRQSRSERTRRVRPRKCPCGGQAGHGRVYRGTDVPTYIDLVTTVHTQQW
jgi:hypothetical protein